MIDMLKRLAGKLPLATQQQLKRHYFARQIKNGTFNSDEPEFTQLANWISEGDCVLDVGANVGHYTARLSQLVGDRGRVIALEPVPETFELLAANVARFQNKNVTLINAAASDKPGVLGMEVPSFDTGLKNYYRAKIVERDADTSVNGLPVDSLSIPDPVGLVKIDVEGHVLEALAGMRELLQRDGPRLIVEGKSKKVAAYLEGHGYSFEQLANSPNRVFMRRS